MMRLGSGTVAVISISLAFMATTSFGASSNRCADARGSQFALAMRFCPVAF
jgi:hypothetical protein